MSKYMKDKFSYLGIPKPARALLQKEFLYIATIPNIARLKIMSTLFGCHLPIEK